MKTNVAEAQVPPGFVLVKKGGRPKKEARDAAIFLAKIWRMQHCDESSSEAEDWIIAAWESLGKEESAGIGDDANVRSAIRRARERGLSESMVTVYENGMCVALESANGGLKNGARVWVWNEGMHIALEGKVRDLTVTDGKSEIARAVSALLRVQS